MAVGAEDLQCPQCGILFSKWLERESNVASGNISRYAAASPTSSGFNWTILAIVCLAIVGIFYWIELSSQ
jgi:hypothetical protein